MSKNAFLTNWNSIYFNETLVIFFSKFTLKIKVLK